MTETAVYKVWKNGCAIAQSKNEKRAIRMAKAEQLERQMVADDVRVFLCIESGEYQSTTQVWPTAGRTVTS